MKQSKAVLPRWQTEAKEWLISSLRTESQNSDPVAWNIGSLIERVGVANNLQKSKRTWERFLASLSFLACNTETSAIVDELGESANTLVINQLAAEARRSRAGIAFLSVNKVKDFDVATVSTTKGRLSWTTIQSGRSPQNAFCEALGRLLEPSALILPNGRAVNLLASLKAELCLLYTSDAADE